MSVLNAAQQKAVAELLRVSPVADELGRRFAAAGHELHLVGGSVRDALLGRLGDDLDFCTDARPEQTLAVVQGWADAIWETGREFGTIGIQKNGLRLEITTYPGGGLRRGDPQPGGLPTATSLLDDLSRRDFTINAMAVSLPGHVFTDPFGGLADLAAQVIRTPAAPSQSFGDDPLRMLRAARFAAKLRFTVDESVVVGDAGHGGRSRPDHRRADPRRVHQAAVRRRPDRRAAAARRHRAGRPLPARAVRAQAGDRRARPAQGRLRAHADRGRERDAARGRRRPRLRAADGRAHARRRQAGHQGGRPGRPGQLPPPRGGRRPADQAADEGA